MQDRKYKLIVRFPKEKTLGVGILSVDKNGEAVFFEGNADHNSRVLATMLGVKLEEVAAHVMILNGFEPTGFDKSGRQITKFQQWYLLYTD